MAKKPVRFRLMARPWEGPVVLAGIDPRSTPGVSGKRKAAAEFAETEQSLAELQERLWAENRRSLLLVLQGTDTSGKDGTVKHVMSSVNPQGCRVITFKAPTDEERRHHFLWRIRRALPGKRFIVIFNRSHYEDVLVPRVENLVPEKEWSTRYDEINRFEQQVVDSGTTIVKAFLHISFEEQRKRLVARLRDPTKHWKFDPDDLMDRALWTDYQIAYEDALNRCSTGTAPWYVIPADRKWYRHWAVGQILCETLEEMDPRYPDPVIDVAEMEARLAPT
jgi:PPK2 family polyphosphate:nucleotide phosphotransferase